MVDNKESARGANGSFVDLDQNNFFSFTDRIEKEVIVVSAISHSELETIDNKDCNELEYTFNYQN